MKFSEGERLIITLLCDIHEKLGVTNSIDASFVSKAVRQRNEWALEWQMPGLFDGHSKNRADVDRVVDTLIMWSSIESSYENLDANAQEGVRTSAKLDTKHLRFPGWDGNNETDEISIARMLIDEMDRFSEFKGRSMNSHSRSVDIYNRMLASFRSIRETSPHVPLSASEISSVMNERINPSSR